jgi:hypothetical protein
MTIQERVDYFVDQVAGGQLAFDQVRGQLESEGLPEQEIKMIVRQVDDEVQGRLLGQSKKSGFNQMIFVGLFLALIGLILTIGSLVGFLSKGIDMAIFAYGPLFAGLVILFAGIRRKKRKNISNEFSSRIAKKRGTRASKQ